MAHGGDRYSNKIKVDFSVNTNPLGIVPKVREALLNAAEAAEFYPEEASAAFVKKLAACLDTDEKRIVAGNGASELLMAAVHALRPGKAVLTAPSFSGYIHALASEKTKIVYSYSKEENGYAADEGIVELIDDETDIVIITNPNNPTGKYADRRLIEEIVDRAREKNAVVIIDECFMQISDDPSNTSIKKTDSHKNLIILGAFTKSFAIPGLRLGYMICSDEELICRIKEQLPEWNVSTLAQEAGSAALDEKGYLERTRELIAGQRDFLVKNLTALGFKAYSSSAGFILLKCPAGLDLYDKLLKRGILIRDCSDFEGLSEDYVRIQVRQNKDNELLIAELRKITEEYYGKGRV